MIKPLSWDLTTNYPGKINHMCSSGNVTICLTVCDGCFRLFEGEVVDLPGGEEFVSIKDHPSAGLFCMSRLAKKFVVNNLIYFLRQQT